MPRLVGERLRDVSGEHSRFVRPPGIAGIEALYARFEEYRYEPHFHESWIVAWVQQGAAQFALERGRHVAPGDHVFVIPPGRVHTGESASVGGYSYAVLYVEPTVFADLGFAGAAPVDVRSIVFRDPRVTSALRRAHRLLNSRQELAHGSALVDVISALSEHLMPVLDQRQPGAGHVAVARARAYIDELACEEIPLPVLARHAGLTPSRLSQAFRRELGVTPHAYQRAVRIERAKHLLRAGMSPAAVAADAGFYDQAHLTHNFRRLVGVTPARYARG
jgi:AraC-like DNA-binding protein